MATLSTLVNGTEDALAPAAAAGGGEAARAGRGLAVEQHREALRRQMLRSEQALPTSGLARLWRTGRGAAGLASAVIGGRGGGLSSADLDQIAGVVSQLGELKGVAMKMGQILSYIDPTMPAELRGLLALLQTSAAASPQAQVEATLREALGARAEALLARLSWAPVAVASIGQVHRAQLADGAEVAVKVRHPGIAEALRSDFRAAGMGTAMARLLGAGAGGTVRSFVDEARAAMLEECDFRLEAERQQGFAGRFASDEVIVIPRVEAGLCAEAVLVTRWQEGLSLDALLAGDPPQALRDRLGEALFRFYVGALYEHGLFHADPHPGNYAFRADGRVVIYDFGCVRAFDAQTVAGFARLLRAVRADERQQVGAALRELGGALPEDDGAWPQLRGLLRGFFAPLLVPGAQRVDAGAGFAAQQALQDKRALMKLALPGRLLFLLRLRFGLYAVLARLGARVDWARLESGWAQRAEERGAGLM